MKAFIILTFLFSAIFGRSQITQINSGTSVNLRNLSIIGNNVVIGGLTNNYIVKSYNECNQIVPVPCPGPSVNYNYLQRLDSNNLYLLTYGTSAQLYKSVDGGNNWIKKLDSTSIVPSCFAFFDTLNGITDKGGIGNTLFHTTNGGSSWTSSSNPLPSVDLIKIYGDSLALIGGVGFPSGIGAAYISKNRGASWTYALGFGSFPTDFFFYNKDTIFAVGGPANFGSQFSRSYNGGNTWQNVPLPIYYANGIYFKNSIEGYVVGSNSSGIGIILRTFDLGQTWQTFNSGIVTRFLNIRFVNDSIALLTGTGGVIARWNCQNAVFTGIYESTFQNIEVKIFPNPVKDKITLEIEGNFLTDINLKIYNSIGQPVITIKGFQKEIDLSFLKNGLYILELSDTKHQKILKFIKD